MDIWHWLGFAIMLILTIFVGGLAALILWRIYRGDINLNNLISEPNGDASLSRFQLLIFTFVITMSLFYLIAIKLKFPDVPPQILGLLGISGGSYVISKGIQTNRDTSLAASESEQTDSAPIGPDSTDSGRAQPAFARESENL